MCVYVYMCNYVRVLACSCASLHARARAHLYIYIYNVYVYIHTHTHTHICIRMCICLYRARACVCVCVNCVWLFSFELWLCTTRDSRSCGRYCLHCLGSGFLHAVLPLVLLMCFPFTSVAPGRVRPTANEGTVTLPVALAYQAFSYLHRG